MCASNACWIVSQKRAECGRKFFCDPCPVSRFPRPERHANHALVRAEPACSVHDAASIGHPTPPLLLVQTTRAGTVACQERIIAHGTCA